MQVLLANRSLDNENGPIEAHKVGVTLTRHVGGGIHEDIDLTNYGLRAVSLAELAGRIAQSSSRR